MDILVSEVGPRDGLQSLKRIMPTADKHRWIAALAAAGLREIEVGSFVSPRALPQMADCAEVVGEALKIPGLRVAALVPNLKYAELAFKAGAHLVSIPVSVSEPHSISNIRRTHAEIIAEVRAIVALRDASYPSIKVEAGLSTAFGCTIKGPVAEDDTLRMADTMAECGVDTVNLADTVGYANPAQVKRLFTRLRQALGGRSGGAHLHNTRGLGLANVVAALEAGVTTFDSSQGGLGGCPYAPGATGNIVTEDLVFMLESMGLATGIDFARLLQARALLAAALPGETLYGHVAEAGLPKGFTPVPGRRSAVQAPQVGGASAPERGTMLPLAGIRVVEFSHMVMGPSCGLVLGDLGADVIKVEPVGAGDNTRRLPGSGAGFFQAFNRNKRSLALDVRSPKGLAFARTLVAGADVVIENFRPGALTALGLGYEALKNDNPRLIYCSLKGFLTGPYENRAALDEVVQMMGGLAYMTGPPGRPLRAGAPVNDIMGGMFAVIGILAALAERARSGRGQLVRSALFENNAFLVSPHIAQFAVTGVAAPPMPARISAWGVYDVFDTGDGKQIFIAVVTDTQWRAFCAAFALGDLLADAALATNALRVKARERLLPRLRELFATLPLAEIARVCETSGIGFAPILRPDELLDDPHLACAGAMVEVSLPQGGATALPALPIEMNGQRLRKRLDIPRAGEHSAAVARELGFAPHLIAELVAEGVLGLLAEDAEIVENASAKSGIGA